MNVRCILYHVFSDKILTSLVVSTSTMMNNEYYIHCIQFIVLYILIFSRMKIFSRNSRERYTREINFREMFLITTIYKTIIY